MNEQPSLAARGDNSFPPEELASYSSVDEFTTMFTPWLEARRRENRCKIDRDLRAVLRDRSRSNEERTAARRALASLSLSDVDPWHCVHAWCARATLNGRSAYPRRAPSVGVRPRSPNRAGRSTVRGSSRRSSARSGDSGDDDPDEPGPARRCKGCGTDISALRSDAQTCSQPKCKKRAQRKRADSVRYPGQDADPYLTLPPWERDSLQQRSLAGCRCNGHHVLDGRDGDCVKCGHPYRENIAPYYLILWQKDRPRSYVRARTAVGPPHPVARLRSPKKKVGTRGANGLTEAAALLTVAVDAASSVHDPKLRVECVELIETMVSMIEGLIAGSASGGSSVAA